MLLYFHLLKQIMGSRPKEKQIESLHEKLSFFLSFLEDFSHKNTESTWCLEARIRDATYEAEDIIELHVIIYSLGFFMSRSYKFFLGNNSALQIMMPMFHNSERHMEFKQLNFKEKQEDLQKIITEIDFICIF